MQAVVQSISFHRLAETQLTTSRALSLSAYMTAMSHRDKADVVEVPIKLDQLSCFIGCIYMRTPLAHHNVCMLLKQACLVHVTALTSCSCRKNQKVEDTGVTWSFSRKRNEDIARFRLFVAALEGEVTSAAI